jgi:hypothetical protein
MKVCVVNLSGVDKGSEAAEFFSKGVPLGFSVEGIRFSLFF